MPKFLSILFLALLCCSCSCAGVKTPRAASSLVSHVSNSTVALVYTKITESDEENADGDKPRATLSTHTYCTAVWISKTVLLSAYHCIRGVAEVEEVGDPMNVNVHYTVFSEAPQPFEEPFGIHLGSVLKADEDHDLVLIKALGDKAIPEHSYVGVANSLPAIGSDLVIVGHPKGLFFSVYKGNVAGYRETLGAHSLTTGPWLQVEAPVYFGNSGGGAFDSDGNVVGIANFIAPMPDTAFFVDCNIIRKFLADAVK